MPILDGYRATHLIRHHNPYSSIVARTVPIVAMTASAIQGDREKCERAGMNDYLAKPVKSKTLEKMLVKWAIRLKKSGGRDHSFTSQHTEHDSNCADLDALGVKIRPAKAKETVAQQEMAASNLLPSAETEGERGLRRELVEEKAQVLRNDKLLNTASEDELLHRTSDLPISPSSNYPEYLTQRLPALTEENMGKFGREQAESSGHNPPALGREDSADSTKGHDPESSSSTVGSLKGPTMKWTSSQQKRMQMNRNNSDMSQKTVTPDDR